MAVAFKPLSWIGVTATWLAGLPAAAVGPIFAKELRVSSRRRRNYVLRAIYLGLLTALVALVWLATIKWDPQRSYARRVMMTAEAGKWIVTAIVWFQFCMIQLITVILLSTSISEEIYHRTLGVLMTTPIYSFQIVVGKLFSKMLQLLTLLAMSLPLLVIVRVLGGVPWDYVVAGLCITLATAIFAASVTMFFSIFFRRAIASILLTLGVALVLYGVLPAIFALGIAALDYAYRQDVGEFALPFLVHGNPFVTLQILTISLFEPRATMSVGWVSWPVTCLVLLSLSAGLLALCVVLVRRAALRQAAGASAGSRTPPAALLQPPRAPPQAAAPAARAADAPNPAATAAPAVLPPFVPVAAAAPLAARPVRSVTGSPVVWKELHAPWVRRKLLWGILLGVGGLLMLMLYALVAAVDNGWEQHEAHAVFITLHVLIATVTTAVLSACNITAEKEASSWEILLVTPLANWQIVLGKAVGTLRRCLPVWLLPLAHALFFIPFGYVHPVVPVFLLFVMASVVLLFTGSGLYFGARFKRTTTAVMLNIALALAIWLVVPGVLFLSAEALPYGQTSELLDDLGDASMATDPIVQAAVVGSRACGEYRADQRFTELSFRWEGIEANTALETLLLLAGTAGGYGVVGLALAALATWRIRRKIF